MSTGRPDNLQLQRRREARVLKWDAHFMAMAVQSAWLSKDPREKVGCLIVSPDRRMMTSGYNGFPAGIEDSKARLDDKYEKNRLSVHAELNAILNARRDLSGWTLYVTKPACLDCAKAMVQAGIVRVVTPELREDSSWYVVQRQALDLLREAGVQHSTLPEDYVS